MSTELDQISIAFSPSQTLQISEIDKLKPLSALGNGLYVRGEKPPQDSVRDKAIALRRIENGKVTFRVLEDWILWKNPTTEETFIINGNTRHESLLQLQANPFDKQWYEFDDSKPEEVSQIEALIEGHRALGVEYAPIPVKYLLSDTQPSRATLTWLQESLNNHTKSHSLQQQAKAATALWESIVEEQRAANVNLREAHKIATAQCCALYQINEVDFGRMKKLASLPAVAHRLLEEGLIRWRVAILVQVKHELQILERIPGAKKTDEKQFRLKPAYPADLENLEAVFEALKRALSTSLTSIGVARIQQKDVEKYFEDLKKHFEPDAVATDSNGAGGDSAGAGGSGEGDGTPDPEENEVTIAQAYQQTSWLAESIATRKTIDANNVGAAQNALAHWLKVEHVLLNNIINELTPEQCEAKLRQLEATYKPYLNDIKELPRLAVEPKQVKAISKLSKTIGETYIKLSGEATKTETNKKPKEALPPAQPDAKLEPVREGNKTFTATLSI